MTDATETKPTEADEDVSTDDNIKELIGDGMMNAFREGMDTGVYTNVIGVLLLVETGASVEEIKENLLDMKQFLEPGLDPGVVARLKVAYDNAVEKGA